MDDVVSKPDALELACDAFEDAQSDGYDDREAMRAALITFMQESSSHIEALPTRLEAGQDIELEAPSSPKTREPIEQAEHSFWLALARSPEARLNFQKFAGGDCKITASKDLDLQAAVRAVVVAYLRAEAGRRNATEGGGWCARLADELERPDGERA